MRINEHNLDSLRKVVRDLQQENNALKALLEENGIPFEGRDILEEQEVPDEYDEDQGARILPFYATEEMAREFYSYFWGRTDVYARRWKNGGYFPQCAARWDNARCPKARDEKTFCDEDCGFKAWKPLELWMIVNHLRGVKKDCTDVIGVYPLFPNNTCRFLVFDFDNHEKDSYKNDDANTNDLWKSEVDALRRICEINGVDVLAERSRSGRGAHIWIFFKSAVPAALARAFGYALLDRGAASINLPSFKYYDRMYPSQDVLSKLGNLVALPLQGQALKQGNSAFVDEAWNAYPDQWKKLRSVKKLTEAEIEEKLVEWNRADAEGGAGTEFATGKWGATGTEFAAGKWGATGTEFTAGQTEYSARNRQVRPWKKDDRFRVEDVIGGTIHLVLDDGVYVDTLNLLPRIQNQIKGLATIDNPQFYDNKKYGRSNYYNLRTISMWSEVNGYIKVPLGLLETIKAKTGESGIGCDVADERYFGRPIRVKFVGELRDKQEFAAARLERFENGVLSAPTAFGKTVLAAYMVAERKVNTLILLDKADLIPQWISEFEKFLEIDEKPPVYYTKTGRARTRDSVIGTLKAGQDKTTGIIDFALIGSAYHKGEFFANIDSYGMVLIDECHHIASAQGQALMQRIRAKYIYGLSATPSRSDRLDDIIYMLLGPVRHKYTAKEQADEQGLGRFVVPRFTRVANITGEKLDIHRADALIAESDVRNEQIVADISQVVAGGRTPVVLTKLKRHAETLAGLLAGKADHVFLVYGGQSEKQNQHIIQEMLSVPGSETLVLVATGQKIGEGFNFPRLDTLMLAAPIKFEGRLVQYVGRLNRVYEGKREVVVYDYVDPHIGFFDRQYRSRLAAYKNLGYKVMLALPGSWSGSAAVSVSGSLPGSSSGSMPGTGSESMSGGWAQEQVNAIYDRRDYTEVFERDLIEANKEIVVASPGLTRKKVVRFMELVKTRQEAGVTVTVITLDPEAEGYENTLELHILIEEMKNNGIYVRTTEDASVHYAVIDREVVWHGGINLLGKEDAWDNLIRVRNKQAAAELIEISEGEAS